MVKSDKKRKKQARKAIRKACNAIEEILDKELMYKFGLRKLNQQTNKITRANEMLNKAFYERSNKDRKKEKILYPESDADYLNSEPYKGFSAAKTKKMENDIDKKILDSLDSQSHSIEDYNSIGDFCPMQYKD